jgi:hypothetical protein
LVDNGNYINRPSDESKQRSDRLKRVFRDVDPIEITGIVDLQGKNPQEIARILPKFTTIQEKGGNPSFAILTDPKTGRAWSLRSGFSPEIVETFNGMKFKTGIMTKDVAQTAGGSWAQRDNPLGAHVEGQAAAFMRKMEISEGVLYINSSTHCKGPIRMVVCLAWRKCWWKTRS